MRVDASNAGATDLRGRGQCCQCGIIDAGDVDAVQRVQKADQDRLQLRDDGDLTGNAHMSAYGYRIVGQLIAGEIERLGFLESSD